MPSTDFNIASVSEFFKASEGKWKSHRFYKEKGEKVSTKRIVFTVSPSKDKNNSWDVKVGKNKHSFTLEASETIHTELKRGNSVSKIDDLETTAFLRNHELSIYSIDTIKNIKYNEKIEFIDLDTRVRVSIIEDLGGLKLVGMYLEERIG